ncbi:hypothetical protein LSH36_468g00007 [Paralvinella palmiformis]|uniref:Uncharacterized protein n=1 Tax=Paralvinella palmiformis TaxID=53620 RepID=A0AAD9J9G4_9ANNE|nr:hypothetical protein LSH36_468g00007 [Paralvinella palmiformis]
MFSPITINRTLSANNITRQIEETPPVGAKHHGDGWWWDAFRVVVRPRCGARHPSRYDGPEIVVRETGESGMGTWHFAAVALSWCSVRSPNPEMSTQHVVDDFRAMSLLDHGVRRASSQPLSNITEETPKSRHRERIQTARSPVQPIPGSQHHGPQSPIPGRQKTSAEFTRPRSPGHLKQASDHESQSASSTPTTQSPTIYSSGESWAMAQDFLSSGSKTYRSHHRRSRSHKARYFGDKRKYLEVDDWELGDTRPRVASMPCRSASKGYISCDYSKRSSHKAWPLSNASFYQIGV